MGRKAFKAAGRCPVMRGLLVVALLLVAGCFETATPVAVPGDGTEPDAPAKARLAILETPRSTFRSIVCDPECIHRMTTAATGPANEVMVAQDYTDPSFLLAAAKDYRVEAPDCVFPSVYASRDGGRTWTDGYVRMRTPASFATDRCESDPVVGFDGLGNGYLITLTLEEGLWTYKTSDHGATWQEVAPAYEGRNDKNWMATDYGKNRIYSITRLTCTGQAVTYSDDQGASWRGPFCWDGMDDAQIDVAPDGTAVAIGLGDGCMAWRASPDGEAWWHGGTVFDGPCPAFRMSHQYRTPKLPDMGISIGTGSWHVVWHSGTDAEDEDIYYSASFDNGTSWLEPIIVNDDGEGNSQFVPAVHAGPAGDVHVIWFDARNDPTGHGHVVDVYYAHSPDGRSFEPNIRLTPTSFVPYLARHQSEPFFIGDYIGLTASNTEAVAVFPTTGSGRAELHAVIIGGPAA